MSLDEKDIILKLIQTDQGRDFAIRQGWELISNIEYNSTSNNENDNNSNSNSTNNSTTSTTNVCDWYGITCGLSHDQNHQANEGDQQSQQQQQQQVIRISLTGQTLGGSLPTEFGLLTNLQVLILSNCGLTGTIPIEWFDTLTNLRVMDLAFNKLTGSIPSTLPSLSSLHLFSVAQNQLTGRVPSFSLDGKNMTGLETLDLKMNRLTGSIPDNWLQAMPELQLLDVSNNFLTGNLPQEYPTTTSLERLYLQHNQFTGSIPETITNAISLKDLYLSDNQFTGTLPLTLGGLENLEMILIDGNRLTGTIPSDLCEMSLNEDLSGGPEANLEFEISQGRTPIAEMLPNFPRVPTNPCDSVACSAGSYSANGVGPCQPCKNPHLNPHLGAKECIDISESEILDIFFNATNGHHWGKAKISWKDPFIPICEREGLICSSETGNVVRIKLEQQNLSGTLPLELGYLSDLIDLDVSHNNLSGHIPEELALAPLERLDLSENKLTGYVPGSLCRKEGLNGNGQNGVFDCDIIACPMRTYHPDGHAGPGLTGEQCKPCNVVDGLVLANTDCGIFTVELNDDDATTMTSTPRVSASPTDILIVTFVILVVIGISVCLWRYLDSISIFARRYRIGALSDDPTLKSDDLESNAGRTRKNEAS